MIELTRKTNCAYNRSVLLRGVIQSCVSVGLAIWAITLSRYFTVKQSEGCNTYQLRVLLIVDATIRLASFAATVLGVLATVIENYLVVASEERGTEYANGVASFFRTVLTCLNFLITISITAILLRSKCKLAYPALYTALMSYFICNYVIIALFIVCLPCIVTVTYAHRVRRMFLVNKKYAKLNSYDPDL